MDDKKHEEKKDHTAHEHHLEHEHHVNHTHHHEHDHAAHSEQSVHTIDGKQHHEDIESNESSKSNSGKNSIFIVLIITGIIIAIIAGIVLLSKYSGNNGTTIKYNNYVFEKFEGNKWITQQLIKDQLYNIPFYNNPLMVEDIPVDPNSIDLLRNMSAYNNVTVYITVDPLESSRIVLAGVEYARILGTAYNMYNMNVKSAIDRPYNNTVDVPIITCKNQSANTIIIYPVVTDKNLVSLHGHCILIESINATESIRVADAFAFRLLNIVTDKTVGQN